jgi:hypothetical protein
MKWYLEEMTAFHEHSDKKRHYDIDLHMSDLVAEFYFMQWLRTECRFARSKARSREQTLNREVRRYNDCIKLGVSFIPIQ